MPQEIINEMKTKMQKATDRLVTELASINTGQANPQILSNLQVEYYGTMTPINQVANVSAPDAQTLAIAPYDKSALAGIETAIQTANLGFNPINDGSLIRISIPPLTKERRQEFTKLAKATGEDSKVAIRNIRRDANDQLKKAELAEDDLRRNEDEVQKQTNAFIAEIETIVSNKEKDIMTI